MVGLGYLLDTNILSEPIRPLPSARLMEKLALHRYEIATATVVIHELLFGCEKLPASRKKTTLLAYVEGVVLREVPTLSYDLIAASWHATERARLEKAGRPAPFRDGQIAAIAKVNDLTLVTANGKDFRGFRGLKIENWL